MSPFAYVRWMMSKDCPAKFLVLRASLSEALYGAKEEVGSFGAFVICGPVELDNAYIMPVEVPKDLESFKAFAISKGIEVLEELEVGEVTTQP